MEVIKKIEGYLYQVFQKMQKKLWKTDFHTFFSKASSNLKKDYSLEEKKFFWRIVSLTTLFFCLISTSSTLLAMTYKQEEIKRLVQSNSAYYLDENGYMFKPDPKTEIGDRSDVFAISDYEVQPGDTAQSIAKQFGLKTSTITQNNSQIKEGEIIRIPASDGYIHSTKTGETISSISNKYGISRSSIITQNQMSEEERLVTGREIIIPNLVMAPKNENSILVSKAGLVPSAIKISRSSFPYHQDLGGILYFPALGSYTQSYHEGHKAIDIARSGGSPIYAAESGKVIKVLNDGEYNGGYGNYVIIDHGDGLRTLYAHLQSVYVSNDDWLSRGSVIGYMGNTGRVFGPTGVHLHFEVHQNGVKQNPDNYF